MNKWWDYILFSNDCIYIFDDFFLNSQSFQTSAFKLTIYIGYIKEKYPACKSFIFPGLTSENFNLFSAEYKFDQSSWQRWHIHGLSNRKYMIMIYFSQE